MSLKLDLYLTSLSHRGPVNALTPNFGNINCIETMLYRNNEKFNYCFEIQSKTVARISFRTLNSLNLPLNQIHI